MTTPKYTLKTIDWNPNVYTPLEYKQEPIDPAPMQRAAQITESRSDQAIALLGESEKFMYNVLDNLNEEDKQWFNDTYRMPAIAELEKQLALGNTQTVKEMSQQLGRDIANDDAVRNRMMANKMYQDERAAIMKSDKYNDETKLYWDYINKYNSEKAAQTGTFDATFRPYEDINLSALPTLAAKILEEHSIGYNNSTRNNNYIYKDAAGNVIKPENVKRYDGSPEDKDRIAPASVLLENSSNVSTSQTRHWKPEDEIVATMNLLLNDTKFNGQLNQNFTVNSYAINEYNRQRYDMSLSPEQRAEAQRKYDNVAKNILDENGQIIKDYDTWVSKKVKPIIKSLAYDRISTGSSTDNDTQFSKQAFADEQQKYENSLTDIPDDDTKVKSSPVTYKLSSSFDLGYRFARKFDTILNGD